MTSISPWRARQLLWLLLTPLLLLPGVACNCGGDGPSQCVPGQAAACACSDGRQGAQQCQSNGSYGPCSCTGGGDAGSGRDAAGSDGDTPTPDASPLDALRGDVGDAASEDATGVDAADAATAEDGGPGAEAGVEDAGMPADGASAPDASTGDAADAAAPEDSGGPAEDAAGNHQDAAVTTDGATTPDALGEDAGTATLYTADFEGSCPAGWTLSGDWQCGTPSSVGPTTAQAGTQCLGTQLAGVYSDLQSWGTSTATSPAIDLSAVSAATASFAIWVDTEGAVYDGANLKLSTDAGASFVVVTTVSPAYPLTIDLQPAWGGHQSGLGWQTAQADLSAYVGQTVLLQFDFRSDASGHYPGVYVDELVVTGTP